MKITAPEFGKLIRECVQEEVRRQLPGLIREHLTETYIKRLLGEQFRRKAGLAEALDQTEDEEVTPEPLSNDDEGIYQKSVLVKENVRDHVKSSKLLAPDNPMAFIYEGVKPMKQSAPTDQPVPAGELGGGAGVNLDKLPGLDFSVMKTLAGVDKKKTNQRVSPLDERVHPPQDDAAAKKAKLREELRRKLSEAE